LGCMAGSCGWRAPKVWAGHTLSLEEWQALLSQGRSPELRGLKGREKSFRGVIVLGENQIPKFDPSLCFPE
jgi:hypothetical protein